MATLNITEYKELATDVRGRLIQAGDEPHTRSHNVTFTTASNSDTLKKSTRFVRLIANADAYIEFGATPTAVAGSMRIEANTAEYFGVSQVKELKISVYDGTS